MLTRIRTIAVQHSRARLLLGILVLGSLWGLSEVVLNGVLRASQFPYRAGLLTGIGMAITAMSVAYFRNLLLPIGIALVAVAVTLLSVPVLHLSVFCKANSNLAVILEAGSLSLVGALLLRKRNTSIFTRAGSGALAAVTASAAFYLIGNQVAPCNYLLSFKTLGSFIVGEGVPWAVFSAALLPVGYMVGERTAGKLGGESYRRLYVPAGAVVMVCWVASALAIAAGF